MSNDDDDVAPYVPEALELSQDVQALMNNGLDFLDKAREELEASKPKW
ncbi:hsdR, partial [Klebsiella pneumoniae]